MAEVDDFKERRDEDIALCNCQAILLLDELDPNVFAIQASATGISIYPRSHYPRITTWEQTLLKTECMIPSAWTGALSRLSAQQQRNSETQLATAQTEQEIWRAQLASEKARAVAFSLTHLQRLMQEFLSDGATTATPSIQAAPVSTFKGRFGARQMRKTDEHSS